MIITTEEATTEVATTAEEERELVSTPSVFSVRNNTLFLSVQDG